MTTSPIPDTGHRPDRVRRRRRSPWPAVGVVLVVGTVAWLVSAYAPPDMTTSRVDVHGDPVRYALLLAHIGTASVATLVGLAALWSWPRRRHPRLHRWIGRIYFAVGVFPSALVAVPVALQSESGLSDMAGLLVLAGLWAATSVAGLRAARERRFADHRQWMVRNYAITLAGIASRPWGAVMAALVVPISDGPLYHGDTMLMIHDIASGGVWLGIVGNLVVAEICLRRRRRVSVAGGDSGARSSSIPRQSGA